LSAKEEHGNTALQPPLSPAQPAPRVLSDWWEGLLWPRVLRSAVLGLRPGRLGLAFFFTVALLLVLSIGRSLDAQLVPGGAVLPWHEAGRPQGFAHQLWHLFVALPWAWLRGWPITTLIAGPLLLVLGAVLLGAISRMTAEEFAHGRQVPWHQGLAFSARLWRSTTGAYVGPIVVVWLLALLLAAGGAVLFSIPVLNIIGGVLFGLFLLVALAAVIVAVAFVLGEALLVPAVVCDGSDAIDAVQRAYAYVLARPLRLIAYLLLGLLGVTVVVAVIGVLVWWTIAFAAHAAGAWARPAGWNTLWWASFDEPPPGTAAEQPTGTFAVAGAFIRIWVLVPILLVAAAFFSTSMAAATVVYLAIRRVCDGQDVAELWTPGAIEATMAEVMSARGKVAQAYDVPEAAGSDLERPDYR
jgi:hypothetical protein